MDPLLGQIQAFGFNFAPRGWAKCDGQLLSIAQFTALYSLLGTTYGGDGRTTFALPNLQSRSMVHAGHGGGLSTIRMGQTQGAETVTLNANNVPSHTHTAKLNLGPGLGNTGDGVGHMFATNASADTIYTDNATASTQALSSGAITIAPNGGGGQSFNIRNPFVGVNICIALYGAFPSRS